jgi:hypothetical protein
MAVAELPSLDNASPNGLALHNGNMLYLLLALGCLTALVGCWGRKARCLLILPLELTSSCLTVLVILLLMLRVVPLKLLLRRALILLELLRWVA